MKPLRRQQLRASCKIALLLVLLCLLTLASSAVPMGAQTYDELYFQSLASPWHPNGAYHMDTVQPSGASQIYNSSQAEFETRVLAADQTYSYYHVKLWVTPGEEDMRAGEYVLHAYVGVHIEGQLPEWAISNQELVIPTHTEFDEFELNSTPTTVKTGQRLVLRLELSFEGQIFYWGDAAKSSSLVTNHATYQGVPIPEFPPVTTPALIVLIMMTAGLLKRVLQKGSGQTPRG